MRNILSVYVDSVVSQTIPIALKMLGQTLLSMCAGNIAEVIQGTWIKWRCEPNS